MRPAEMNNTAPRNAIAENVARNATMTSLELLALVNKARAEFGESAVRHADFAARCRDELDGEYYETFVVQNSNGTTTEALRMSADQCKLVAMRESKGVRRAVVARLNELEAQQAPRVPQTLAEALRLAADQAEQIEQQQAALAIAAPKAAFVDQYVENTGSMSFRQAAKLLKANERRFRQLLLDKGVMYYLGGTLTPYQHHIDAGRFQVKTGTSERNQHAFTQSRFTPKGVQWVAGLWAAYQMEVAA